MSPSTIITGPPWTPADDDQLRKSLSKIVERECVPHHAVPIAPGLWLASPKNGNISNVGQRLSTISLPSCANLEYRDGQPIHKRPQLAGTSRICRPTISS